MRLRDAWEVVKGAGEGWMEDKAMRMGAAIAYYTILSVAPLLVIAIAIAGLVFHRDVAQHQLVAEIRGLVGDDGGKAIETMLAHASKPGSSIAASILGVIVLLFGASGVFTELQDSLNTVWEVAPKPGRGLWTTIRDRFLSFAMIVAIGFLLLVSLAVSTALSALVQATGLANIGVIGHLVSFAVSFAVITLLFALIFKILPDVKMSWGDVWIGAIGTALLFTIGKFLIGLYLGHSGVGSTYGAAGSLVVFVVWVYYSALILLFGAEFTKVYANRFGAHIEPAANAVSLSERDRIQQGIPREQTVKASAQGS